MLGAILFAGLPFVFIYLYKQFKTPETGLWISLVICCISAGLTRYIPAPWGLTIDIFLFLSFVAFLFMQEKGERWSYLSHDYVKFSLVWFGFMVIELANPESRSMVAWFYSMRSIGIDMILSVVLVFLFLRDEKHFYKFVNLICWLTLAAAIWGMRQKFLGTDAAENRWLAKEENGSTHLLFGVLRTFSFHSDAGQFGGNMAMMTTIGGVLALGPHPLKTKIFYAATALFAFIGFGISGSRGALVAPAVGGIVFLFMQRNFPILILGLVIGGGAYGMLKYTMAFQNVEAVRRMRTGLDPDNPSLHARFRNQKTYRKYLASRPIGAGIGSAGYWGKRFSPGTVPAETPTDSYFVRIWAEMGIIGLLLNIAILGYWIGRAGNIIWNLRDPILANMCLALFCGFIGMIFSSYGNQILSGFPTNMMLYIGSSLVCLAPLYERQRLKRIQESLQVEAS